MREKALERGKHRKYDTIHRPTQQKRTGSSSIGTSIPYNFGYCEFAKLKKGQLSYKDLISAWICLRISLLSSAKTEHEVWKRTSEK